MYHLSKGNEWELINRYEDMGEMVMMHCYKHTSSVTAVSLGEHCGKGSFKEG